VGGEAASERVSVLVFVSVLVLVRAASGERIGTASRGTLYASRWPLAEHGHEHEHGHALA